MKKIEVTLEDVKNSNGWDDYKNCPLAVAFRRQFPEVEFTQAGVISIYKDKGETEERFFSVARLEEGFLEDNIQYITKYQPWTTRITFDPVSLKEVYAGGYVNPFPTE